MFVKYIRILSCCIAASPIFSSAHEMLALHSSKIKTKAVEIERQMTRDYYIRCGLIGIVAARIAYMGIIHLTSKGDTASTNVSDASVQNNDVPQKQQSSESIVVPKISWGEWTK